MIRLNADVEGFKAAVEKCRNEVRMVRLNKPPLLDHIAAAAWRIGCALSNRIIQIDHVRWSTPRGMTPALNGSPAPKINAFAMVSVLGWGAFRCLKTDGNGRIVATAYGHPLKRWRFGRVALVEKPDTTTCEAIPVPQWERPVEAKVVQPFASTEYRPGDFLVLTAPRTLSVACAARMRETIERLVPGVKAMVLEEGMTLGVLRKAEPALA